MSKSANLNVTLNVQDEIDEVFGASPQWKGAMQFFQQFGEGTTLGNFDLVYMAERTVASDTDDDIDLAGSLESPLGESIAAAEIVAIFIINKPLSGVNTTALTIGAADSNAWAALLGASGAVGPIQPGGVFLAAAGHASGLGAVTAGTGDILRVSNAAGASNTYQIAILARSA